MDRNYLAAWYTVVVFFILYCLSFVDRLVLSLLAAPVTSALHLSDTEMGLLLGPAFGVVYAVAALPLAHMIDNRNRIRLVSFGVLVWSVCTISSAFSPSYVILLMLRAGVAAGEAVLSAAAISIIADLFTPEKRAFPTAVYISVGTFMGAGAFVLGGFALSVATQLSASVGYAPWQLTLVLVGLPGIVLAALLRFTVREPTRRDDRMADNFTTTRQALSFVGREAQLYGYLIAGLAVFAIGAYASPAWVPTLLVRGYGFSPASAGYAYGTVGLVAGISGTMFWPVFIRHRLKSGHRFVKINLLTVAALLGAVSLGMVGLAPNATSLFAAAGIAIFFTSVCGLVPALIIQDLAPGRMRARLMAAIFTAMNLVGLVAGPVLVPLLAERLFSGSLALGSGLSVIGFTVGPASSLMIWLTRERYKAAMDASETTLPRPS